ncbi:hypothetical protein GCM10022214_57000 [Actinomadura miaoliensis]|uniref:Uncharacterized protein n=1 Tax=Actinomadura miaoliensis TaxID=430685 RepID=A0ABP7WIN0_9ACTN
MVVCTPAARATSDSRGRSGKGISFGRTSLHIVADGDVARYAPYAAVLIPCSGPVQGVDVRRCGLHYVRNR